MNDRKGARQLIYALNATQPLISPYFMTISSGLVSHLVCLLRFVLVLVSLVQLGLRRSLCGSSALHVSSPPKQLVSLALSACLRDADTVGGTTGPTGRPAGRESTASDGNRIISAKQQSSVNLPYIHPRGVGLASRSATQAPRCLATDGRTNSPQRGKFRENERSRVPLSEILDAGPPATSLGCSKTTTKAT